MSRAINSESRVGTPYPTAFYLQRCESLVLKHTVLNFSFCFRDMWIATYCRRIIARCFFEGGCDGADILLQHSSLFKGGYVKRHKAYCGCLFSSSVAFSSTCPHDKTAFKTAHLNSNLNYAFTRTPRVRRWKKGCCSAPGLIPSLIYFSAHSCWK